MFLSLIRVISWLHLFFSWVLRQSPMFFRSANVREAIGKKILRSARTGLPIKAIFIDVIGL